MAGTTSSVVTILSVTEYLNVYAVARPILMAPKFGLGDGSSSSFDGTLVLATMLVSQLQEGIPPEPPEAENSTGGHAAEQVGSQPQGRSRQSASVHPSDHTRVWSELSGSN